ncbi:threonine synthase [Flavobacteriales bacterium ALC-1]|nr:threonine synthase [Flavobacteriales bacterium ALC-1]
MKYFSLNHNAPEVSFKEAVIKGLAPDRGLYFPKEIKALPDTFFQTIENLDNITIAYEAIKQFVGDEIPKANLKAILTDVLSFDFPIVTVEENIAALELYHGPTMAFKDVGARFMARCLGYFNKDKTDQDVTVLVATSGDTGGAVANGFLGVDGVDVTILYPSGKVSDIQEKQLTTLGQNITALEVDGTFDDCQTMVKEAFLDEDYHGKRQLTSANSINIARWLPQMFYFFFAYKALKSSNKKLVFSVPSGNYGNICAGMMAQKLGLPVHHFVTGTNANNIIPEYLNTGLYSTKPSVQTISNAMDVGAPSNFIRIQELHNNDIETLRLNLSGYSYTDTETTNAVESLFANNDYIADPHGAIGYLALKAYLKKENQIQGVFLETAHPIKFLPVMPKHIAKKIEIPVQIEQVLDKQKESIKISNYKQLKSYLLA